MKNLSLLAAAGLVAIGCSENPSAPNGESAVLSTQNVASLSAFRPPPPMETIGEVSSAFSAFNATYFLNGPENNGWISFGKTQPAGTTLSSPSARISFHKSTISGTGILTLRGTGGVLTVDLSTGLSGANFFGSCGASCGSFQMTGVNTNSDGKFTTTVTANLRNPAYRGGGDVVFFVTHQ